jgi:PadR family transcriptional regulator, regulatory protein AphA
MNSHYMTINQQVPTGIELALLGFLRQEPIHGYEIYHRLTNSPDLRLIWRMKQSRLYAMLDRLEQQGLLKVTPLPQENRPPRKMLQLSPTGLAVYRVWLVEPVAQPREMRLTFMLKLYFARQEGAEQARQLIQAQQIRCLAWLDDLNSAAVMTESGHNSQYAELVQSFRRGQMQAMMVWLIECRETYL